MPQTDPRCPASGLGQGSARGVKRYSQMVVQQTNNKVGVVAQLAHRLERGRDSTRKRDTQGQRGVNRHRMQRSEELTVHFLYRRPSAVDEPVSPSIGHPLGRLVVDVQFDGEGQRVGITALNGLDAKDRRALDHGRHQRALSDAGHFGAGPLAHTMTLMAGRSAGTAH